jgi:hypothetical protein
LVFVAPPSLATKARIFSGPHFNDRVLSSSYLPSGTVVGLIPGGIASGYQGQVDVETSIGALVDTPLQIAIPGSPPTIAAPVTSGFQTYLVIIKVRVRMAWCIQPACVATVSGASW